MCSRCHLRSEPAGHGCDCSGIWHGGGGACLLRAPELPGTWRGRVPPSCSGPLGTATWFRPQTRAPTGPGSSEEHDKAHRAIHLVTVFANNNPTVNNLLQSPSTAEPASGSALRGYRDKAWVRPQWAPASVGRAGCFTMLQGDREAAQGRALGLAPSGAPGDGEMGKASGKARHRRQVS